MNNKPSTIPLLPLLLIPRKRADLYRTRSR